MGNPFEGGGGGKGGPESMFGGSGGKGDEDPMKGNMAIPGFGTMNIGQWTGLTKPDRPQTAGQATADTIGAATAYMPMYNQMIRGEAPKFAQTENRLKNILQEGEKNRIGNIGQKTVRRIDAIAREQDPQYYANRSNTFRNAQELMRPGLTGGEIESIRRGLRTDAVSRGTDNVGSNMNTIAGATTFGEAARDRMERSTALGGTLAPTFRSMLPESIFSMASGRDINSTGTNQSDNITQGIFQTKLAEMGLLGDREKTYHDGLGKLTGSVCGCYIFRAHYGIDIPWWVIFARDHFHEQDPMLGHGYKRMAKWLVPLMKRWTLVRKIVDYAMIRPLTLYGGYMYHVEGFEKCHVFKPIVEFWFKVWRRA